MIELPPYARLLEISITVRDGSPVLEMPYREPVVGRPGFVHGGAIGGLLEMAALVALISELRSGPGRPPRLKPINLTVDFMRGGRERTSLARGTVMRLGARVANVEAIVWQDDPSRPIASGRINYRLRRPG